MKKLIIAALICWSPTLMGQLNVSVTALSISMEAGLIPWYEWEKEYAAKIEEFSEEYRKRGFYYAPTLLDGGNPVFDALDELILRIDDLQVKNNGLGLYAHYLKRDNTKRLNDIERMALNMDQELDSLDDLIEGQSIYGERLNLNQNTRVSVEILHRRLDQIESEIDKSTLLNLLFSN